MIKRGGGSRLAAARGGTVLRGRRLVGKGCAAGEFRIKPHLTHVPLEDGLGQRQSDSGTLIFLLCTMQTLQGFEYSVGVLWVDSNAIIADRKFEGSVKLSAMNVNFRHTALCSVFETVSRARATDA